MTFLIVKTLLTAVIIVTVSEVAKRSGPLGGLIAAMPLTSVLALIWLYAEGASVEKLGNHAAYTLIYVLPTLPMFAAFPFLITRFGFWPSLLGCLALTSVFVILTHLAVRGYGFKLL